MAMVMARLHLICGNCGCNDEWEWGYVPEEKDEGEIMVTEDVYLSCRNCITLHSINDNATKRKDS
jgi:hypothetical protein